MYSRKLVYFLPYFFFFFSAALDELIFSKLNYQLVQKDFFVTIDTADNDKKHLGLKRRGVKICSSKTKKKKIFQKIAYDTKLEKKSKK